MSPQPFPGLFVGIHAMPCTNRCRHCWAEGTPAHRRVPTEQVYFILEKMAEIKELVPTLSFAFYDEPTTNPQWIDFIEWIAAHQMIWEYFALPTNGSILSRAPDEVWERLMRAGAGFLQLTVYGLEATHDAFAGRRGAFQDVITTIRRANEHQASCFVGVPLHTDNVHELGETLAYLRGLVRIGSVGAFPFLWQGRGRDPIRVRASQREVLPEKMRQNPVLVEERAAIGKIMQDPDLASRPASEGLCSELGLQVDRDLRVYFGGACDGGGIANAATELRESFFLGSLTEQGFRPLVESYVEERPRVMQLLDGISWGELAERYGDRENDEIYYLGDLPSNKWAAAYLRETLQ